MLLGVILPQMPPNGISLDSFIIRIKLIWIFRACRTCDIFLRFGCKKSLPSRSPANDNNDGKCNNNQLILITKNLLKKGCFILLAHELYTDDNKWRKIGNFKMNSAMEDGKKFNNLQIWSLVIRKVIKNLLIHFCKFG